MASRFNMLNPASYAKMDPTVRKQAAKDMAFWVGTQIAVATALAQIPGVRVSLNPDDSDFLQIRYKNKVYDLTGGMSAYARTTLRLTNAALSVVTSDPKYIQKKQQKQAGESLLKFFRNKLAPNPSYFLDLFVGSNRPQGFDPYEILKAYPMYVDDVIDAWKSEGVLSLATVLVPNMVGIGYGSYSKKGELETDLNKLIERNTSASLMDYSNFKNYNSGGNNISEDEFAKYAEKVDDKVENYIRELYNDGKYIVDDNNSIVKKKYSDLTADQVDRAINSAKQSIANEVKLEMFGEPSGKQLVSNKVKDLKERQLRQMDKKNYSEIINYKKEEEGVPITDEEYIKYTKEIDKLLTKNIDKLVNEGMDVLDEKNKKVHKDFSELTNDEINKEINKYVNESEDFVEDQMFGEPSRSVLRSEKVRARRQRQLNQRAKRKRMREYKKSDIGD
jgi:hypothetical protein